MNSLDDIWEQIMNYCRKKVSPNAFRLWLSTIEPQNFDSEQITLKITNSNMYEIIVKLYDKLLAEAIKDTLSFPLKINYITPDEAEKIQNFGKEDKSAENLSELKNEYTFENFIVGSSNKLCYAAAKAIAKNPGGQMEINPQFYVYNPLFIHGNSGLGKTHLLLAIKVEITKLYPQLSVIYTRGEDFTNEFINSLQNKCVDQFKEKYRNIDVLLIDDIQFIAGKQSVQEEFFHTFDALVTSGKQVVLTSDRPPKEIQTLEDRLRSRFECGLIADVNSPDYETRIAIINRKAQALDFNLPMDVVEYIAEKIKSNVRQLEGTVKKLHAKYMLEKLNPTIFIAQSVIKDVLTDSQPTPITIQKIVTEVSRTFNVLPEDIYSEKRNASIKRPRQVAMYIVRNITGLSFEAIGTEFNKHHSTIMYSINVIEDDMKTDSSLSATVNDIIKNIKEV